MLFSCKELKMSHQIPLSHGKSRKLLYRNVSQRNKKITEKDVFSVHEVKVTAVTVACIQIR